MKHTKYEILNQASLLNTQSIENFDEFLSKNFEERIYSGKIVDGTQIAFDSLGEFLQYPNSTKKQLISLDLSCSDSKDYFKRERALKILFKNSDTLLKPESISYHLEYNDREWGFKFEDDLISELADFKPIYNILTYFNLSFGLSMVLGLISLVFILIDGAYRVIGHKALFQTGDTKYNTGTISSILFASVTLFVSGYLLNKN